MKINRVSIVAICTVILLSACNNDEPKTTSENQNIPDAVNPYTTLSVDKTEIKNRLNDFSFRLLNSVSKNSNYVFENENANFAISPISLALNLSMMANSSTGDISNRIATTLGVGSLTALNDVCKELSKQLQVENNGNQLILANSIWYDQSYDLQNGYSDLMRGVFNAHIKDVNFKSPSTVNLINSWCNEYTKGVIPSIIDNINPNTMAALINATYYKGRWLDEFNSEFTTKELFTGVSETAMADMMHAKRITQYFKNNDIEVVSLPFVNPDFEMVFINDNSFNDFTTEYWNNIISNFEVYEVDLSLPKFEIISNCKLNKPLNDMGISLVGDLKGMLNSEQEGAYSICQKNTTTLNEEGVVAASVTFSPMYGASPKEYPKASITFNRPFIYILHHKPTGAILMAGRVCNI